MFDVVLFNPEIPPNTGNVIRLCANTGCRLHLIKPLGFAIDDRQLRRAGLDYHEYARVKVHDNWSALVRVFGSSRMFAFSTKATTPYHRQTFAIDDVLVFGSETAGLPIEVLSQFAEDHRLRVPMLPQSRSLNLSNAVAVVVYEAWRQIGFGGSR
jgi:tRNA (cytidine/uridine-2'-O-)-methyltransferase